MPRIPTLFRATRAFIRVVRDVNQLDEVFTLVDTVSSGPAARARAEAMLRAEPSIQQALREQPRLGRVDVAALSRLPEGTLGRAYADFLTRNGLDPTVLPVREARDAVSYANAHIFETHDVWHVVTGFGPEVEGELGLQAFYLAQMPNPMAFAILMAGLMNTAFFAFDTCATRLTQVSRGWVLGRRAKKLFGTDWKALWARPLAEVRTSLGVDLAAVDGLLRPEPPVRPLQPLAAA
jgi:ubiquinone biosynthesis protein Coq4